MMLQQQGAPGLVGNSGEGSSAAATSEARESSGAGGGEAGTGGTGGVGGFNEEERGRAEEGERNSGGNRWPRQETLALLKIRSDMDVAFRDSSLKGPLWDEVSRKLAALGYHRSSKKCKEKFENVYKYHKRTKDGRTSKPDGKTYRFFDQLEALDTQPPAPISMFPPAARPVIRPQIQQPPVVAATTMPAAASTNSSQIPTQVSNVPSITTQANPISVFQNNVVVSQQNVQHHSIGPMPSHQQQPLSSMNLSLSNSSSSATSSDEEPERRRKRKRKWKVFFGRLMKDVVDKQEELQKRFLETLEKRERDRMMREEAWRVQEMGKMNREHELLVQERSVAAAKDAAVIAFLQKITDQPNLPNNPAAAIIQTMQAQQETPLPPPPPPAPPAPVPPLQQQQQLLVQHHPPPPPAAPSAVVESRKSDNGSENFMQPSPSRWPKAEVHALIQLRTTLDTKYHENGPKGPLWEEISAAMRKLGYNRNAKRCKEKWENINKYYKKVKESNKKRPEDAKTCPYFHQLEALYKEKEKSGAGSNPDGSSSFNPMVPIMARPEQQWPLPMDQQQQRPETKSSGMAEDHEEEDEEDDDEDTGDEDDDGDEYEIVTNKPSSTAAT